VLRLNFRSEFFNICNHLSFGTPYNSLTSPLFASGGELRLQSPVPDRRPTLDPTGAQALVLIAQSVASNSLPLIPATTEKDCARNVLRLDNHSAMSTSTTPSPE
jgi:hypothetical protein